MPTLSPFPCGPAVCFTVEDTDALARFVVQVRRWRIEVQTCKAVKERKVVVPSASYEATMFSIMASMH